MPYYKEDIPDRLGKTHCPSETKHGKTYANIPDFTNPFNRTIDLSYILATEFNDADDEKFIELSSNIYNLVGIDGSMNECGPNIDYEGCCYVINSQPPSTTELQNKYTPTSDHYMGLEYILDDNSYNIYHTKPIKREFDSFLNDPNNIRKFFNLLLVIIVMILIITIIGSCYEFWLKLGQSINCIYYKNDNCEIGPNNKISVIDYIFPIDICYFPYQTCNPNSSKQYGGTINEDIKKGFISKYAEYKSNNAKCITTSDDSENNQVSKPFPYNVADWSFENIENDFYRLPFKAFSYHFLFTVILIRFIINSVLSFVSKKYQENITNKNNYITSNIIFLLLTGLIFPIIAYFAESPALTSGPMFIILPFMFIISFCGTIGVILPIILNLTLIKSIGFVKPEFIRKCNIKNENYYYLFNYASLMSIFYNVYSLEYNSNKEELSEKIKEAVYYILKVCYNFIKNIFIAAFVLFPMLILYISIAFISNGLAIIYMNFSFLFNLFYIPLSNNLEFFDIIKSHGNLLTILFCIAVIGSSTKSFNPTTTGIMSIALVAIIFYKVLTELKS